MPSKKTDWSDEGSSVHGAAASILPQYTLFGDIDKSTSPSLGRNTRSGAVCMSCPTEEVRQYWVLLAPVLTSATRASRSSSPRTVCECMKTSSSWAQGLHNISACSCHSGFPGHPCTHPSLVLTSKGKRKEGFISSHFSVFVYNPNELFDSFHVGQSKA